jgi:hypothetical protein
MFRCNLRIITSFTHRPPRNSYHVSTQISLQNEESQIQRHQAAFGNSVPESTLSTVKAGFT